MFWKKENWVTQVLIILNIVAFVLVLAYSDFQLSSLSLLTFGAKYSPAIAAGQWWRLVTAIFLHGSIEHLFLNMLTLYFIGLQVERYFGHGRFLVIYLLGGIAGNILSFTFNSQSLSVGASGAIFALFGAFLMFGQFHRHNAAIWGLTRQFLVLILLNLIFVGANVDWQAHVGGLIAGYLLGYTFSYPDLTSYQPPKSQRILASVAFIIIYGLLYIKGLNY